MQTSDDWHLFKNLKPAQPSSKAESDLLQIAAGPFEFG
jgi:hypothetical protein